MTKKGDPNPVVMLNSFQHLVKIFSAFGRHTFHPRPQDGVFRCDLNKIARLFLDTPGAKFPLNPKSATIIAIAFLVVILEGE